MKQLIALAIVFIVFYFSLKNAHYRKYTCKVIDKEITGDHVERNWTVILECDGALTSKGHNCPFPLYYQTKVGDTYTDSTLEFF